MGRAADRVPGAGDLRDVVPRGAELLERGLEPSLRACLREVRREFTVRFPVQMDDGGVRMFEGYRVKGNVRQVYSRGELVVEGGKFLGNVGRGNYLRREARGGAWQ